MIRLINALNGSVVKQFIPVELAKSQQIAKSSDLKVGSRQQVVLTDESLPPADALKSLHIQPASIDLRHPFDTTQVIVTGRLASGDTVDVTRLVTMKLSDKVATISESGLITPAKDGIAKLTATLNGQTANVPMVVAGMGNDPHLTFVRDVAPTLSKLGCNNGSCHGANKGKGGFKLSLRGNDFVSDVRGFTDDNASRRVNLASPQYSLMLMKAVAEVPHLGGQVTRPGEPYYEIVRRWIADGARLDDSVPRVTGIEIFPRNPVVQRIGDKHQFRVVATYANGQRRDVTSEAFISSGDSEVAGSTETGLISTLRRGEAPILARYEGRYTATTLTVMGDRTGFVWREQAANNFIDELIAEKLKRTKTAPSELCTDAEFIRRAFLDLTGVTPTTDDVQKFVADKRATRVKRDALVDRLIGGNDYVTHWTNKWADLLQVNRKFLGAEGAKKFQGWIRGQLTKNTPYDQFVHSVLTASGSNLENPEASYFKVLRTPGEAMENSTHLFLGVRFSCNKCHDHPFERWVQNNYWETPRTSRRSG